MQAPSIYCVGLTHRTAPVALRELVSSPPKPWDEYLGEVLPPTAEWSVLSTCNRFEIYVAIPAPPIGTLSNTPTPSPVDTSSADAELAIPKDGVVNALVDLLTMVTATNREALWMHLYYVRDEAAAEHLCCVASGLESLVFGEPQILGQVTDMFMSAIKHKSVGPALTILLQTAIRAGKRTRYETAIGRNATGVSTVALKLAESMVSDLSRKNITVVGLGEMGQLTIRGLRDRRIPNVNVVNRSYERAQAIAVESGEESGWRAHPFQDLAAVLAQSDIVFAATGATEPIITMPMMEKARDTRHAQKPFVDAAGADSGHNADNDDDGQKMLLFDMAVPRDICPDVAKCAHVYLTDIDQLQSQADSALNARKAALPHVHQIIAQELATYEVEISGLKMRPLVVNLRLKAEQIRKNELKRTLRLIGDAEPELATHLALFSKALVNKILHEPTIYIKEMAHEPSADEFAETIRNLFDLSEENAAEIEEKIDTSIV